jgi:hypothetical protein
MERYFDDNDAIHTLHALSNRLTTNAFDDFDTTFKQETAETKIHFTFQGIFCFDEELPAFGLLVHNLYLSRALGLCSYI